MRPFLEFVTRNLVDDPGAVEIEELRSQSTVVYRLRVAPADVGKVIGKHGRTAHAMRLLLQASAARTRQRAVLEIQE
jgi:predicted RNA-binding protein YlqC (UPF0109 family)